LHEISRVSEGFHFWLSDRSIPDHPRSSCEKDKKAAFLANQFLNSTTFDPVLRGIMKETGSGIPAWAEGFRKRFGIVYVDHETQERVIKDSGYWYQELIKNNHG
jgi:beta-glucosidase/6-phospho-beta-glucosidase/beta-galactosidase